MGQKKIPKKWLMKRKAVVEHDLMYSVPFRELSGKNMWVLLRFLQKQTWHKKKVGRSNQVFYENDNLSFTYAEAQEFGISTSQFYRSIKKLVEVGFLDVEHRGGAYGQDYSRFKLSDRWKQYGTKDFKAETFERLMLPGHDVRSRMQAKQK